MTSEPEEIELEYFLFLLNDRISRLDTKVDVLMNAFESVLMDKDNEKFRKLRGWLRKENRRRHSSYERTMKNSERLNTIERQVSNIFQRLYKSEEIWRTRQGAIKR